MADNPSASNPPEATPPTPQNIPNPQHSGFKVRPKSGNGPSGLAAKFASSRSQVGSSCGQNLVLGVGSQRVDGGDSGSQEGSTGESSHRVKRRKSNRQIAIDAEEDEFSKLIDDVVGTAPSEEVPQYVEKESETTGPETPPPSSQNQRQQSGPPPTPQIHFQRPVQQEHPEFRAPMGPPSRPPQHGMRERRPGRPHTGPIPGQNSQQLPRPRPHGPEFDEHERGRQRQRQPRGATWGLARPDPEREREPAQAPVVISLDDDDEVLMEVDEEVDEEETGTQKEVEEVEMAQAERVDENESMPAQAEIQRASDASVSQTRRQIPHPNQQRMRSMPQHSFHNPQQQVPVNGPQSRPGNEASRPLPPHRQHNPPPFSQQPRQDNPQDDSGLGLDASNDSEVVHLRQQQPQPHQKQVRSRSHSGHQFPPRLKPTRDPDELMNLMSGTLKSYKEKMDAAENAVREEHNRRQRLEQGNAHLQDVNGRLQQTAANLQAANTTLEQENSRLKAELEMKAASLNSAKGKIENLHRFLKGMGNDYHALMMGKDALNSRFDKLKDEYDDLLRERRQVGDLQLQNTAKMNDIKMDLAGKHNKQKALLMKRIEELESELRRQENEHKTEMEDMKLKRKIYVEQNDRLKLSLQEIPKMFETITEKSKSILKTVSAFDQLTQWKQSSDATLTGVVAELKDLQERASRIVLPSSGEVADAVFNRIEDKLKAIVEGNDRFDAAAGDIASQVKQIIDSQYSTLSASTNSIHQSLKVDSELLQQINKKLSDLVDTKLECTIEKSCAVEKQNGTLSERVEEISRRNTELMASEIKLRGELLQLGEAHSGCAGNLLAAEKVAQELRKQNEAQKETIRSLEESKRETELELSSIKKDLTVVKEQLVKTKEALQIEMKAKGDLQIEVWNARSSHARIEGIVTSVNKELSDLKADMARNEASRLALVSRLEKKQGEVDSLATKISTLEKQLDEITEELAELQQAVQVKEDETQQLTDELADKKHQLNNETSRKVACEIEVKKLKEQVVVDGKTIEDLKKRLGEVAHMYSKVLDAPDQQLDLLECRVSEIEQEKDELSSANKKLQRKLEEFVHCISSHEVAFQINSEHLSSINEPRSRLDAFASALREKISSLETKLREQDEKAKRDVALNRNFVDQVEGLRADADSLKKKLAAIKATYVELNESKSLWRRQAAFTIPKQLQEELRERYAKAWIELHGLAKKHFLEEKASEFETVDYPLWDQKAPPTPPKTSPDIKPPQGLVTPARNLFVKPQTFNIDDDPIVERDRDPSNPRASSPITSSSSAAPAPQPSFITRLKARPRQKSTIPGLSSRPDTVIANWSGKNPPPTSGTQSVVNRSRNLQKKLITPTSTPSATEGNSKRTLAVSPVQEALAATQAASTLGAKRGAGEAGLQQQTGAVPGEASKRPRRVKAQAKKDGPE